MLVFKGKNLCKTAVKRLRIFRGIDLMFLFEYGIMSYMVRFRL